MPKLFVYGTLRIGERNNHMMKGAKLVATDCTLDGYEMRDCIIYPCAIKNPDSQIHGDIYEITMKFMIEVLDPLEGTDHGLYIRHYDSKNKCYIYIQPEENKELYPPVDGGDWLEHIKQIW